MAAIPVPYIGTGVQSQIVLGHYGVGQTSGAIAATPTALDAHASIRWAPAPNYFLVLMRQRTGWGVLTTVVNAAVRIAYQLTFARAFSSDYSVAATAISMLAGSGRMRSNMSPSVMGANGPRICTTAPQTTVTSTLDTAPFAIANWSTLASTNSAGTVTIIQIGTAGEMKTLYEWTALGAHPVVLSNAGGGEGVVLQITHTGWATGTVSVYTQWEWGECLVF